MPDKRIVMGEAKVTTDKEIVHPISQDVIKCANCYKELVHIVKIEENDTVYEVDASCPFCGDGSFTYAITGQNQIFPPDDLYVIDMPVNCDNKDKYQMSIELGVR